MVDPMPVGWIIEPEGRFVVLIPADPSTFHEWRAAMLEILAAARRGDAPDRASIMAEGPYPERSLRPAAHRSSVGTQRGRRRVMPSGRTPTARTQLSAQPRQRGRTFAAMARS